MRHDRAARLHQVLEVVRRAEPLSDLQGPPGQPGDRQAARGARGSGGGNARGCATRSEGRRWPAARRRGLRSGPAAADVRLPDRDAGDAPHPAGGPALPGRRPRRRCRPTRTPGGPDGTAAHGSRRRAHSPGPAGAARPSAARRPAVHRRCGWPPTVGQPSRAPLPPACRDALLGARRRRGSADVGGPPPRLGGVAPIPRGAGRSSWWSCPACAGPRSAQPGSRRPDGPSRPDRGAAAGLATGCLVGPAARHGARHRGPAATDVPAADVASAPAIATRAPGCASGCAALDYRPREPGPSPRTACCSAPRPPRAHVARAGSCRAPDRHGAARQGSTADSRGTAPGGPLRNLASPGARRTGRHRIQRLWWCGGTALRRTAVRVVAAGRHVGTAQRVRSGPARPRGRPRASSSCAPGASAPTPAAGRTGAGTVGHRGVDPRNPALARRSGRPRG